MHILITANAAWNLANFRQGLIRAVLKQGHRVTVLAAPDERSTSLIEMGCRLVPLAIDVKGLSPHRDLALVLRFLRHFRRERPDVILSYTIKNNIFGAFAAGLAGIPFIPTVTGLGTAFLSGAPLQGLAEALYRGSFRRAQSVFFQNADDLAFFLDRRLVRQDQARLVPGSGVDLARFQAAAAPAEGSAPTFLMIGRLLRDKGALEYAAAARRVKARYPQARFLLLGQMAADNRSAVPPEKIEAWEAEGVVSPLGHVADVRPAIAAADCVVLPSYREGAPRALLEGAAMARPVIASNVPGCRDVVEDDRTGFLCEVRSAESLHDAMIRFIKTPHAKRVQMGQDGRAKMEREYDERIVVAAYEQMLASIEVGRSGRGVGIPPQRVLGPSPR